MVLVNSQSVISEKIIRAYRALKAAPSLSPSEAVNRTFTELVGTTRYFDLPMAEKILHSREIDSIRPDLQRICSTGEFLLEKTWAEKIAASARPKAALKKFPYYANYEKLVAFEAEAFAHVAPPRKILFIGSGPLPLSAIILAQRFQAEVDCIDIDASAVAISRELVKKTGLAGSVRIDKADVMEFNDFGSYDAVILAALVGGTRTEKNAIIGHIRNGLRPGSLLLLRSARALRTLLYPEVDRSGLSGFRTVRAFHPTNEVVNSIIVAQK